MRATFWIFLGIFAIALIFPEKVAIADIASDEDLLALAHDALADGKLSPVSSKGEENALETFLRKIQNGQTVDLTPKPQANKDLWIPTGPVSGFLNLWNRYVDDKLLTDPVYADLWGKDRTLKAEWLVWLCTAPRAVAKVRSRGIEILGARIEGELNLAWVNLPFPLRTYRCAFTHDITLDGAKLASLQLQSTYIKKSLKADALTVDRDIIFTDGFQALGPVWLRNATINGRLNCDNGQFISPVPRQPFNGQSENPEPHPALNLEGAKTGCVFLGKGFRAAGPVSLQNATIGGLVDCEGGQFNDGGSPDPALNLQGAKTGSVLLGKGFVANGEVRMRDATIGGTLNCDGGRFVSSNWDWSALDLEGAKTGFVILSNSFVWGKVWLYRVTIDGNLECDHAVFVNLIDPRSLDGNAYALNFDYARTGTVILKGFFAVGTVSLLNAILDGSLECDGAKFIHPEIGLDKEVAIRARESFIKGSVRLVNVYVDGRADFGGSQIEHDLRLEKAIWEKAASRDTAQLDLSFAKAKTLLNAKDSWPTQDSLDLDGFTFDALRPELDPNTKTPADPQAETETSWIERQSAHRFHAQPYEQMALVFRNMGLQEEAVKVMIEKNKEQGRHLHGFKEFFWYYGLGKFIGFGYQPWNAFYASLFITVLGYILFRAGYRCDVVTPTGKDAYVGADPAKRELSEFYPRFNALIYSLETFVPLLKLWMSDYWAPNATRLNRLRMFKCELPINGPGLRFYLWCHIILGWILTTLWIGGLTGLVKT